MEKLKTSICNCMKITFNFLKYLLNFSPLSVILLRLNVITPAGLERTKQANNKMMPKHLHFKGALQRANFSYLMPLIYYSLRSHLMPQSLLFTDLWGNPVYSKWLKVHEVNCSIKALNSMKLLYAQSHYHVFAGQWSLWACRTLWSCLWFLQRPC